jgi:hypothetical protein
LIGAQQGSHSKETKEDLIGGTCGTHREKRNAYWGLVEEPEGKIPL